MAFAFPAVCLTTMAMAMVGLVVFPKPVSSSVAPLELERRREILRKVRPVLTGTLSSNIRAAGSKEHLAAGESERERERRWELLRTRPDILPVPGWQGAPTADELLSLWLKSGAAKPDRVSELLQHTAHSVPRGSRNGLGRLAGFPNLAERHGVFTSAWHDAGWESACSSFLNASKAAEQSGAAPLLVEILSERTNATHFDLGPELQMITLAALVAAGLGRPFRAKVPESTYGSTTLNSAIPADWRVYKSDLLEQQEAVFATNVTEAIAMGAANPASSTIVLRSVAAAPWKCHATPTVRHQNQGAASTELIALLSKRMSEFGWNLARLPLTRDLAMVCTVRQLFPPAASVLAEVDRQLDNGVDVEGVGLVLGIHLGSDEVGAADRKRRLACAWKMTTAFRTHARAGESRASSLPTHRGREVAWVLVGGGAGMPAVAARFAADMVAIARSKNVPNSYYGDAIAPTVIAPATGAGAGAGDREVRPYTPLQIAWLNFYLLSESHACTSYWNVCDLARIACISSLRRNLASGLFLEAVAHSTASKHKGGRSHKEPECSHWHRHI